MPFEKYGGVIMPKVLVTYASEHGATAEIAQTIARVMRQFDLDVTSQRVEAIKDKIEQFDVVLVGSAVYLGDWLENAKDFLAQHKDCLMNKQVWLFSSGPTGEGEALELVNGVSIPESMNELVEIINPREVKVFHGKIDLRRLPQNERHIIKTANVPRGDYRDWDAIRQWAMDISRSLTVNAITVQGETALSNKL